jgi:Flp pilus assembly protein TadB
MTTILKNALYITLLCIAAMVLWFLFPVLMLILVVIGILILLLFTSGLFMAIRNDRKNRK